MTTRHTDVAIIGGAIMGSATAYFLKKLSPSLAVTVIEPDPTYEFCSTLRASGGARRLFSCPENIEMSKYSIDFIKAFAQVMAVGEAGDIREAPVDWVVGGYLFILPPAGMAMLESNYAIQRAHGCDVALLTTTQLKEHFPSMFVDDLAGGVLSPRNGWCDPNGLLQGFKRKATSLGVRYVNGRVSTLARTGASLTHAPLASGEVIGASAFVNAAGAWSGVIAGLAGVPLPVAPMRRLEHYFTCGRAIESLPLVKDLARLAFRPEGVGFFGGLVNGDEQRGFNPDIPLGGSSSLRGVWRAICGHFGRSLVANSDAIGSSRTTKLPRNSPRHPSAS